MRSRAGALLRNKGQAGAVMLENGQWAYRYMEGAALILMKMPDCPASM